MAFANPEVPKTFHKQQQRSQPAILAGNIVFEQQPFDS
jgi:hypothetical protein